eukprot:CAMPEP_0177599912 /NCGR_PEP_ID=MMETSP0419_2-20121207/13290_1 /TAXON_ID=582737 /ORGANISM="Tetraselmis sp., Strain GSL018" /LENGTH=595 /DNA_ID=CAMNT_0019092765 /DNA_START=281 /DNA_END=2069 /DNA_ORIENTATION=+
MTSPGVGLPPIGPAKTTSGKSQRLNSRLPSIHGQAEPVEAVPQPESSQTSDLSQRLGSNPFVLPPEEEVFRMREVEKQRKAEERERLRHMSVADKTTFSSRSASKAPRRVAEGRRALPPKGDTAAQQAMPSDHRRKEKEVMADFIQKKREIFLVQMSLDTKRAEIRKLEERAVQREDALKKSERMLEDDALRFEGFLKENDQKVQEAIKSAEVATKAKQDKMQEIKRLNAAIAAIRSELSKYEEQLEDCKKYKDFLNGITPADFFEEQAHKRVKRREAQLAAWEAECQRIRQLKEDTRNEKEQAESDYANARTQQEAERAEAAIKETTARLAEVLKIPEPPEPLEEESHDEVPEMYFKNSSQLLSIFSELEQSNLFLIQNAQESEEALEELRANYNTKREEMEAETASLQQQLKDLQRSIAREKAKKEILKTQTMKNSDGVMSFNGQSVSMDDLISKVSEVYVQCGFDRDASAGILQLLTNIEVRLDEYVGIVSKMPEEFVEATEKSREKERRTAAREQKIAASKREQEARLKRALERARAPIHKKTGKALMPRSQPIRKKKVQEENKLNDEEVELQAFLARPVFDKPLLCLSKT